MSHLGLNTENIIFCLNSRDALEPLKDAADPLKDAANPVLKAVTLGLHGVDFKAEADKIDLDEDLERIEEVREGL